MTKKMILIVEDEPQMRELITLRLQLSGYEVATASNDEDGIKEMAKIMPDLIIMDLMMPGMGGYELCWKLKTNKQFAKIPILIFSARAGDIDKAKGFQCGADDYMTKPFDGEVLVNRVKSLLKGPSSVSYN